MSEPIEELVNRFLAWNLPQTVCADLCVTERDCKYQRFGTNILTAAEARQMLEHVLGRNFAGTAWLIELDDPLGNVQYYCGPGDWCNSPNHAKKFPSEQAARESRDWYEMLSPQNMRIAEHIWGNRAND